MWVTEAAIDPWRLAPPLRIAITSNKVLGKETDAVRRGDQHGRRLEGSMPQWWDCVSAAHLKAAGRELPARRTMKVGRLYRKQPEVGGHHSFEA